MAVRKKKTTKKRAVKKTTKKRAVKKLSPAAQYRLEREAKRAELYLPNGRIKEDQYFELCKKLASLEYDLNNLGFDINTFVQANDCYHVQELGDDTHVEKSRHYSPGQIKLKLSRFGTIEVEFSDHTHFQTIAQMQKYIKDHG